MSYVREISFFEFLHLVKNTMYTLGAAKLVSMTTYIHTFTKWRVYLNWKCLRFKHCYIMANSFFHNQILHVKTEFTVKIHSFSFTLRLRLYKKTLNLHACTERKKVPQVSFFRSHSTVSTSSELGLQDYTFTPGFLHGFWSSHSSRHDCAPSPFPTDLSPESQFAALRRKKKIHRDLERMTLTPQHWEIILSNHRPMERRC